MKTEKSEAMRINWFEDEKLGIKILSVRCALSIDVF